MKRLFVFPLVLFGVVACEDDEIVKQQPIVPVVIDYEVSEATLLEDSDQTHRVTILLGSAAQAAGSVEIALASTEAIYGEHFNTQPAASDGKIILTIAEGATEVNFSVIPINDAQLNGHKQITFALQAVTGSVTLGESLTYAVTILDDELTLKPQTLFKTGLPSFKRTYEYNAAGLISKIHWESKTIVTTSGTDTYHYDDLGRLINIVRGVFQFKYTWENGRVVKLEQVTNDVVNRYTLYQYDEAERLIQRDVYQSMGTDEFEKTSYVEYTYYDDGSLYQDKQYSIFEGNTTRYATITYLEYADGYDPFPLIEELPKQGAQTKCPTHYTRQAYNETPQDYRVTYEFREDGYPIERHIAGPNGVETNFFTYY